MSVTKSAKRQSGKASSTSKAGSSGRRTASPPRLVSQEGLITFATPIVRVVAGVLVTACLAVCAWRLALEAKDDARFQIDPGVLLAESLPEWLPAEVAASIGRDVQAIPRHSIFEPGLERALAEEILASSPWIRTVEEVECMFPNRARLALEIERPVIAIDAGGKHWLLNAAGKVLSAHPADAMPRFTFTVLDVIGVKLARDPVVGETIADGPIRVAARAADELRAIPEPDASLFWSLEPLALDLEPPRSSPEVGKDEIFIRLAGNPVMIRWGRPRDSTLGKLDVPIERKLKHLRQLVELYPKLRGLADVRLDIDAAYFRPLGFDHGWQYLEPEPPTAAVNRSN